MPEMPAKLKGRLSKWVKMCALAANLFLYHTEVSSAISVLASPLSKGNPRHVNSRVSPTELIGIYFQSRVYKIVALLSFLTTVDYKGTWGIYYLFIQLFP